MWRLILVCSFGELLLCFGFWSAILLLCCSIAGIFTFVLLSGATVCDYYLQLFYSSPRYFWQTNLDFCKALSVHSWEPDNIFFNLFCLLLVRFISSVTPLVGCRVQNVFFDVTCVCIWRYLCMYLVMAASGYATVTVIVVAQRVLGTYCGLCERGFPLYCSSTTWGYFACL
jgi:hypothetical protein